MSVIQGKVFASQVRARFLQLADEGKLEIQLSIPEWANEGATILDAQSLTYRTAVSKIKTEGAAVYISLDNCYYKVRYRGGRTFWLGYSHV